MKQNDYVEIANIINGFMVNDEIDDVLRRLSICLADYFAREIKESNEEYIEKHLGNNKYIGELKFNRKQFLKDCGVSK